VALIAELVVPEDERLMAQVKTGSVAALHDLFSQIPDAQREIVSLAFYGGLSQMEIATVLDLPAWTVEGRMRLGLHKLREGVDRAAA
jgi:RNA polymerase sigma factor (sigma-70 family)